VCPGNASEGLVELPLPNSPNGTGRDSGKIRWNSPRLSNEEKIIKAAQSPVPAFRVLIVDRDSMSSDLLANSLVRDRECDAASIEPSDLPYALSVSEFDLVVIGADLNSNLGTGYDLAQRVGRTHPETFIVILLNNASHESVINAFRAGARGVFSRQQPMADFLDCVERVRRGLIWAGKQETDFLLEALKTIPSPTLASVPGSPTLTARELQVVHCAATGKTNRMIANDLGLSEHTVKNYLFRAFEKLGVSSRVELLFYLTLQGHAFGPAKAEFAGADLEAG